MGTAQNPGPFTSDDPNPWIGQPTVTDALVYDGSGHAYQDDDYIPDPAPVAEPATPFRDCYNNNGILSWIQRYETKIRIRRWIHVQRVSDRHHTNTAYDVEESNRTEFGVAVTGSHGQFAAGLAHSATEEGSMGVNFGAGTMDFKALMVHWWYNRLRAYCKVPGGGYWMNAFKWVPDEFSFGNLNDSVNQMVFPCTIPHREPIDSPEWVARATTETWRGWFSIGPVSLNSTETNGASEKLTYKNVGGRAWICGSNASPNDANYVREIDAP